LENFTDPRKENENHCETNGKCVTWKHENHAMKKSLHEYL
jgi:hypothetical protein